MHQLLGDALSLLSNKCLLGFFFQSVVCESDDISEASENDFEASEFFDFEELERETGSRLGLGLGFFFGFFFLLIFLASFRLGPSWRTPTLLATHLEPEEFFPHLLVNFFLLFFVALHSISQLAFCLSGSQMPCNKHARMT